MSGLNGFGMEFVLFFDWRFCANSQYKTKSRNGFLSSFESAFYTHINVALVFSTAHGLGMRHISNSGSFGNEGETGCWMRTGNGLSGNGVVLFSCHVFFFFYPFLSRCLFFCHVSLFRVSTLYVFSPASSFAAARAEKGTEEGTEKGGKMEMGRLRTLWMASNGERMDGGCEPERDPTTTETRVPGILGLGNVRTRESKQSD